MLLLQEVQVVIIVTGTVFESDETYEARYAASIAHVERSGSEQGCFSHSAYADREPLAGCSSTSSGKTRLR
jgi:hypothetical protein